MRKSIVLLEFYFTGILIALVCFEAMAQCVANFTYKDSGCAVKFTNASNHLTPSSSPEYVWTFGDGATDTAQSPPSHTYAASASYTVCLAMYVSSLTCINTICKIITVSCPTGVKEFQPYNSLSVFSNPVRSSTLVHYNLINAGQVKITVFDLLGNVVGVIENAHQNPGGHYLNWNTETLESGIYFLQLNTGGKATIQKIIVANE